MAVLKKGGFGERTLILVLGTRGTAERTLVPAFWHPGTSECTLVPVFGTGEHPPNHPLGDPTLSCKPPTNIHSNQTVLESPRESPKPSNENL